MAYAIVHITVPNDTADQQAHDQWHSLSRKLEAQKKASKGVEELAEGVWQIPLDTNSHVLGLLLQGSSTAGFRCRLLLLEDEPKWIEVPKSKA